MSLTHAEPRAEFKKEGDSLKILFFNDTGKGLRFYIAGEGLREIKDPNSEWKINRLITMAHGRFSAAKIGRKESIGSHTLPGISEMIPDHFDRKRIRVTLEWSDGEFHEWTQSKATVTYYEID